MANKVVIDVEARFIDHVSSATNSASKSIDGIGKSADKAQKGLDNLSKKKAKPLFDADDNRFLKKIRSAEAKMQKMGHKKTAAVLDLVDKATQKIGKVINKAQAFGRKVWRGVLDFNYAKALSVLRKVTSGAENLTRKTWTAMVTVKDMALAPIKAIKNALFSIPTLISTVIAAKVVQKGIVAPATLADQYTRAQIGFSTLLGESRGQQMMDEIDAFAAATPFKTSNVISNVQKMMAYGWDVERAIDDMKTIGDAAAATGKGDDGLTSIVYALSEIRSKGKLSTQELNQLASAGIKAKMYLAQGLGYGTDDAGLMKLAKDLEGGAIGANQAVELILQGMKEFEGMMDQTANETVGGLKDQLEDLFEINVARKWGQGLQDGFKKALGSVVGLLDGTDDALGRIGDTMFELGSTISNWVAKKFEEAITKINEITGSYEFQNASAGEKISMLWTGVVKDPLAQWWNKTGKPAVTETAVDIGKAIGKGILSGIEMAWNALPWWGKLLVGGYGGAKIASGAGNLISGMSNLVTGAKGIIGSTGNYMVSGSGISGMLANVGYGALGKMKGVGTLGKTGASLAGISGGAAAAAGAGGLAMVAGGIKSGVDFYQAYQAHKNGDKIKRNAELASGGSTLAGMGIGAAIGSAILPGVGTLVGGGIGTVVGWLAGDKIAKNIEAAKYESEEMQAAIKDGKKSQEELSEIFERTKWETAQRCFGDVKLSMQEISRLSEQMVWGDDLQYFEKFQSAAKGAEQSLQGMKTKAQEAERWLWKAGLGVKFNADEAEAFKLSYDEYLSNAKGLLENKHYEFASAAQLVLDLESDGGKSILDGGNAFYAQAQSELEAAGTELGNALTNALADGFINADEQVAITAAQEKVAKIMERIADAEMKAELKLAEIKLSEGAMDADSFKTFMDTMSTQIQERVNAQDEAVKVLLSNIELQYTDEDGNITNMEAYQAAVDKVVADHTLKIDKIKADIMGYELNVIAGAFDGADALGANAKATLSNALNDALATGIDPITWDPAKVSQILNTDGLSAEMQSLIQESLSGIFNQLSSLKVEEDVICKITGEKDVQEIEEPTKSEFGILDSYGPFDTTVKINAFPDIKLQPKLGVALQKARGGIVGSFYRGGIAGYSDGGMVRGGSQLIEVAEEGSPEMIIPLSSQRRGRALKLWAQAGNIMGVPGFARGGMTSGNNDEGIRFNNYASGDSAPSGQAVQIDIGGLTFEINVNGGGDASTVVETIKAQAAEIAEVVAGVLADSLGAQFENMPAR